MRVWIIGSDGMLGRAFGRFLKEIPLTLFSTTHRELDICNYAEVEAFANQHQPDIWINCAAYTAVDEAESHRELAYAVNATGPENLARAASQIKPSRQAPLLIHFSTDYIFDGQATRPYRETDLPHPINVYGASKLEGEKRLIAIYSRHLILRLSWLFGLDGNHFVKTMLELMRTRELLRVVDDQMGCPTFCGDIAKTVWQLQNQTGIYHLTGGDPITWHGFAQEIARQARELGIPLALQLIEPIATSELSRAAARPAYSVLDTSLLESLNIDLRPWSEGLHEYLKIHALRLKE